MFTVHVLLPLFMHSSRLTEFMPSYLREKVKGRQGEEKLHQYFGRYKEAFKTSDDKIMKVRYLFVYEQDPSCGQHVYHVKKVCPDVCVCNVNVLCFSKNILHN